MYQFFFISVSVEFNFIYHSNRDELRGFITTNPTSGPPPRMSMYDEILQRFLWSSTISALDKFEETIDGPESKKEFQFN